MVEIKSTDLVSLFEKSLQNIQERDLQEIGFVIQVGDFNCKVHGLLNAVYGELVEFEGGNKGIIFNLDEDEVSIFLINASKPVVELEVVKRTGDVFKTPVGMKLCGRVINAIGKPLDELGDLNCETHEPIEACIAGIIERSPINESLETGIMAIDALVPIGKGQRELILGNRNTGKTSIVIDAILNQKTKNVYCVYVSIGQRQANLARIVKTLEDKGALEYTVVVSADASEPSLDRYLAPYVGCTIAEYFRNKKLDALVIYDDLSNHAIAYREMSLLMRRAPGREAYPGDIFYLHSRLLERAGKLASGGSLTALPLVQIQADDFTTYIPTNLISITDGQIFLDSKLFNNGIRPAVNFELSVSRVGGAAQTKAIKRMTRALKLELAQYHELLDFSQFGTELDVISQQRLARGARIIELLKQEEGTPLNFVDQSLKLFLLQENYLDSIAVNQVSYFSKQFMSYVKSVYIPLYQRIKNSAEISDDTLVQLKEAAQEFNKIFVPA